MHRPSLRNGQSLAPLPARPAGSETSPRILLTEANRDHSALLGAALRNAGLTVVICNNGASACRRIHEEAFDLIVTDVVLPKVDGIELARRARRVNPRTGILFLTAFAHLVRDVRFRPGNGISVLKKPARTHIVVAEIHRMLAGAPARHRQMFSIPTD
jgi:two-component system cell cycle response regulator CpdR